MFQASDNILFRHDSFVRKNSVKGAGLEQQHFFEKESCLKIRKTYLLKRVGSSICCAWGALLVLGRRDPSASRRQLLLGAAGARGVSGTGLRRPEYGAKEVS